MQMIGLWMIGVVYSGGAKRNLAHEALEMHINQLIKLKAAWRSVFFWWAGKRRRSVYEKHLARRSTYFIYVHVYIMHLLYGHRWVLIYIYMQIIMTTYSNQRNDLNIIFLSHHFCFRTVRILRIIYCATHHTFSHVKNHWPIIYIYISNLDQSRARVDYMRYIYKTNWRLL